MRFVFKALLVRHASARFTLTPLDLPGFAAHAATAEEAIEEVTLALQDKISRAHPRHLPSFSRSPAGEAVRLSTQALRVWSANSHDDRPLRVLGVASDLRPFDLTSLIARGATSSAESGRADGRPPKGRGARAARRTYVDVRVPRLGQRFWLEKEAPAGKSRGTSPTSKTPVGGDETAWRPRAESLLAQALEDLDEDDRLALRADGSETLMELVVEATPLRLSDLARRELMLDERPPPSVDEDGVIIDAKGGGADGEDDEDDEDGWADTGKRRTKRRKRSARPRPPAIPTLRKLGTDMLRLAREEKLDEAFGREAVLNEIETRLDEEEGHALVLVGPEGAGKTAVIQELARRWAKKLPAANEAATATPPPEGWPILFHLDGGRLIAGEGMFGDWQAQVLSVVREARAANATLYMGQVEELLEAGKTAHSQQNVADLLSSVLAARELRVLTETTPAAWARVEQRNPGFARSFTVVQIPETSTADTAAILARVAASLEKPHRLVLGPEVVREIHSLCLRFCPYGAPLGQAASFLRRLAYGNAHGQAEPRLVTAADAQATFAHEAQIPVALLDPDQRMPIDEIRAFLRARVKGQEAAVARVAGVVAVIKANLSDRRRPSAVLLFAGPTGVGKTELAKALAELLFGAPGKEKLVRLDMGEYAGPDSLMRLMGDGRSPGFLPAAVRRRPFSVVLLDEIEKAHAAVFDALLGVLGEGRLTDTRGGFTDFRATVFVLTSNIGADTFRPPTGFAQGQDGNGRDVVAHYRQEVRRFFRPELYNRLDDVVVFSPLGENEIRSIVERELAHVVAREGFRRQEATLTVDEEARSWLAAHGTDPRYGARPLKRLVERVVVAKAAAYLSAHPPSGPVSLAVTRADDREGDREGEREGERAKGQTNEGLVLTPSSVEQSQMMSRTRVRRILEEAASLRAEVGSWSRSGPMAGVRRDVTLYDRESRHPAFWADRHEAEQRSRHVSVGRELGKLLGELEQRTQIIEDLAYEAFVSRATGEVDDLLGDLEVCRTDLAPLTERVLGLLYPPATGISLVFYPGRGGWEHAFGLARRAVDWAHRRGLTLGVQAALLREGEAPKKGSGKTPPASNPKSSMAGTLPRSKGGPVRNDNNANKPGRALATLPAKEGRTRKSKPAEVRRGIWKTFNTLEAVPGPHLHARLNGPAPLALALTGESAPGLVLLMAEHGVHRFIAAGVTSLVRVHGLPRPRRFVGHVDSEELDALEVTQEIRRVELDKSQLRDLVMNRVYALADGEMRFEKLAADFLRFRAFGAKS